MLAARFEVLAQREQYEVEYDHLISGALVELLQRIGARNLSVEYIPDTFRWIVSFDGILPDTIISALRELNHKVSPVGSKRTGKFWIDSAKEDLLDIWYALCILAFDQSAFTLDVDIPGASDGPEQFLLPATFVDVTTIEDLQIVPFEERSDCLFVIADDGTPRVVFPMTLEDVAPFYELALEYAYANPGKSLSPDDVRVEVVRKGLAVMLEGHIIMRDLYQTRCEFVTKSVIA
jgi:hypothetical protein